MIYLSCKYCLEEFIPTNPTNIMCGKCNISASRRNKYKTWLPKSEGVYSYKIIIEDHMSRKLILKEMGYANRLMEIVGMVLDKIDKVADKK